MLTSPVIARRVEDNGQGGGHQQGAQLSSAVSSHGNGANASLAMQALRPAYFNRVLANKRRVIKMLFVVVLEYFVCWGPLYTLNTWAVFDYRSLQCHVTQTHRATIFLLAYLSSCVHPITYCFMNTRFRHSFADAFRCCFTRSASFRLHSGGSQGIRLMMSAHHTTRTNGAVR